MCRCVHVTQVLRISVSGVHVFLVYVYKIHNFILNVFNWVCVRMWPGVRTTEMKRKEEEDKKNGVS